MEDVGYETARLVGSDVLSTVCTMLRQRGLVVTEIYGTDVSARGLGPIAAGAPPPAPATQLSSRVTAECAATATAPSIVVPVMRARVGGGGGPGGSEGEGSCEGAPAASLARGAEALSLPPPPAHTAAAVHQERGLLRAGDETWVFSLPNGKVSIKPLRLIRGAVDEAIAGGACENLTLVIISRDKIGTVAAHEFASSPYKYTVQRFLFSELSYNVTTHFLVPHHRMCDAAEIAALKKRFPKLALQGREDAISRFHGLLPGDVVLYNRVRANVLGGPYWREVI